MNIKKLFSVLLVFALLFSMLPASVLAQPVAVPIEGPRVECVLTRSAASVPTLETGNHADYLDRVASVPDYAQEYYRWLVDNSSADGALVDPTKATERKGEYYHCVLKVSGSEQFEYSSYNEISITASYLASAALDKEFAAFSTWGGVVRDAFEREHPEVFWLSGKSSYSYIGSWTCSVRGKVCTVKYQAEMVVWLKYVGYDIRDAKYRDADLVVSAMDTRDAAIREILAGCPDSSASDRVIYLNDALTERNASNSASATGEGTIQDSDVGECLNALVGSSGVNGPVCDGYARAFKVLCDAVGIPCVLVSGLARTSLWDVPENHMWNYVLLDGGWYAVDVTWNDPYVASDPEEKSSGKESRKWLLLGSDSTVATELGFLESHKVINNVRPQGLSYTNGPTLSQYAYSPDAKPLQSIGGKIKSVGREEVTVQLWQADIPKDTRTFGGSNAAYVFGELQPGNYRVTVSKAGHAARTQEVTITSYSATCDVQLCQLGDVTGDGRLNMGDVARIYGHIKGSPLITDPYALVCADVNEDGTINVSDAARLNIMIRR